MNQEIKFRAFDDGVMFYSHNSILTDNYKQLEWFFRNIREDAIVMQFTGITDINGKDVYKGEILKLIADNGKSYGNYEVKQDNESEYETDFYLKRHDLSFNWGRLSRIKELLWKCESIGNIYENPELLKFPTFMEM